MTEKKEDLRIARTKKKKKNSLTKRLGCTEKVRRICINTTWKKCNEFRTQTRPVL